MSCCNVMQEGCSDRIDYSQVIGDRIIPFVFQLDSSSSVLNPDPGENQRFCYLVTGVGEDTSTFADLSHWVLTLCPEITLNQITNVTVTIGGEEQDVVIGDNVVLFIPPDTDPTTGCPGLKFDFGLNKILGADDSVGEFCFELTTPFPVGAVPVCVKGGQATSSVLSICGPVCSPETLCDSIGSQLLNVCVPITVTPFVTTGPITTICCGSATVGTEACTGVPGGSCTFTVSQQICVQVPVNFGANATAGDVFVDCGNVAAGECVCPAE